MAKSAYANFSGNCDILSGTEFARTQRQLARFNAVRLRPGLGETPTRAELDFEREMLQVESAFVEAAREDIEGWLVDVPSDADAFIEWFEQLRATGPGQNDPLFPWLATRATLDQMRWFLKQEVGGEAGFDDLVAMTQVKMPVQAKLEMARNYWDEMGRGQDKGMHGPMLDTLASHLSLATLPSAIVPEALALSNMMIALATNRRFAFHSAGALGVIEMTAPGRAQHVADGLARLGVPAKQRHYFSLHSILDVKHSAAWNEEVLRPLVATDPRRAHALAEGAVLRLWCGERCFRAYREEFELNELKSRMRVTNNVHHVNIF